MIRWNKLTLAGLTAVELKTFGALPTDPFILKEVEGLGPPKIAVNIASGRNRRGTPQSKNPDERQIVATVKLNPDWFGGQAVSDLRQMLYGLLTSGTNDDVVNAIVFNDNDELFRADGWVSNIENNMFSSTPEAQITIDCFDSFFYNPTLVEPYLAGLSKSAPSIVNVGSAPTGLVVDITFTGYAPNFRLTDDEGKFIGFEYDFSAGDRLIFDTRPDSRDARVDPSGSDPEETLLGELTPGFEWLTLHGGTNEFTTSSSDFDWNVVQYQALHWGV